MTLTRMNRFPMVFSVSSTSVAGTIARAVSSTCAVTGAKSRNSSSKSRQRVVELRVDMPGVTPEAIEVKLDGNVLTLSAERKAEVKEEKNGWIRQERSWGRFARSFVLPETVEGTTPEATYKHGVLTVRLPKKEAAQPKSFTVKVEA